MRSFLNDEKGQTVAEYLLLVAAGVVITMAAALLAIRLYDFVKWAEIRTGVERDATIAGLKSQPVKPSTPPAETGMPIIL